MKSNQPSNTDLDNGNTGFEKLAEEKPPTMASEFLDFILHNKKWWLTPIIAVLLLLGVFTLLMGAGAAPFIYTLF